MPNPTPEVAPPAVHTPPVLRVAIAGASGFVGRALRDHLSDEFELIALTRSQARTESELQENGVSWRQCDLFDVSDST